MFELIVISHEAVLPGEAAIIQQLFDAGLEIFHLRKPGASEEAIRTLLDAIPATYHDRIALHGFHHLVNEYEIKRLHFTEAHRIETNSATLSQLRDNDYTLSTSVHEFAELEKLSHHFWYTFFSPVFDSLSKLAYKGIVDDDFYLSYDYTPKQGKVIALGGIDAGNLQKVADMNFDGVAVLGAIWNDPEKAIDNFKELKRRQELIWRQQFYPKSKKNQS